MDHYPLRGEAAVDHPLVGCVRVGVEARLRGLALALAIPAIIDDQERRPRGRDRAHMFEAMRQVSAVPMKEDGGQAAVTRGDPPGIEPDAIARGQPDFVRPNVS